MIVELEVCVLSEENSPLVEIFGAGRALCFGPPAGGGGNEGVEVAPGDADDTCARSLILDCAEQTRSGDTVVAALTGVSFGENSVSGDAISEGELWTALRGERCCS